MTQYGSIQSRSDAAFTGQLAFCPQCDHAFVPNNWGSTLQGFTPITMGAGGEPQYGERTWTCPECANDLKAQIPRPKLAQTDEYLTQAEIARLYGVRPSAVTNWRARHQTFPQPAAQGYPWSAIQAWQEGRGNQPVMTMDELRQQRPQPLDIQEPIRDPGFRLNPELPWPEAESDIWRGRRRNVRPPLGFDEFGDFDPPSGSRVAQYHGYDGMWPDAPAQKITSITSITSSPPPQSQYFRRDTLNGDTTHIVTGDNTKADTRVMDITPNGDDRTVEVIKPLTSDLSPWERNLSQPHSLSRRTKTDRLDEPAIGWPWHTNSVSHSPLSSDQSSLRSISSEGQSLGGLSNAYLRPSFREFPTSWGIRESVYASVSDFDWAGTKSGIKSMLKHAFSVEEGPSFYYRWLPASIRDQVEQSGMVPNPDTGNSMHFWDNMENAQRYGEIANDIEPHDLWEVTGKPGRLNSDPWFKMVNQPEYGDQPGAWQSDATHIPPDRIKRIGSHNEDSPYRVGSTSTEQWPDSPKTGSHVASPFWRSKPPIPPPSTPWGKGQPDYTNPQHFQWGWEYGDLGRQYNLRRNHSQDKAWTAPINKPFGAGDISDQWHNQIAQQLGEMYAYGHIDEPTMLDHLQSSQDYMRNIGGYDRWTRNVLNTPEEWQNLYQRRQNYLTNNYINNEDMDVGDYEKQIQSAQQLAASNGVDLSQLRSPSEERFGHSRESSLPPAEEDIWDKSKLAVMTPNQQARFKAELEQQHGPEQTNIIHTFPDGWSLHHLPTWNEVGREGKMMHHCWGGLGNDNEPYPGDMAVSLRDPNNWPHMSFHIDPADNTPYDFGAHGGYPPDDESPYWDYIKQWSDTVGGNFTHPMEQGKFAQLKEGAPYRIHEGMHNVLPDENGYYYHLAPTEERDRIHTHGLIPSLPANNPLWGWPPLRTPQGVYVTNNPDSARWLYHNRMMDTWRIPVDQVQEIKPDRGVSSGGYITHPVQAELQQPYEWSNDIKWPAQENQGFGELKESALDWSRGMWGRGFQDPEGNYHTWPVENLGSGGKPHHGEMAQQMGLENYQNPVIIGPTGWYTHNTNDVTDDVRGFQQPGMRYTPDFDRWDWKSRIAAPLWENPDVSGAESLHPSNFIPWEKGSWGKGFITPFNRVIHWQTNAPDGQPAHSLGMQAYRWMAPMTIESDEPGFGPFRDEEGYDDPYMRLHPFIVSPQGAVSPHFPEYMTTALEQKLYNAHPDFHRDNGDARKQYDYGSWGTYSKADVPQWIDVNTDDEPDPDLANRRPTVYDPNINTVFAGEPGAWHPSVLRTVMFEHGHDIGDNAAFGWIGHHLDASRSDAVYNRGQPNEVGWYQNSMIGKPTAQAHQLALQKAQEMTRTATSIYEWPEGEGAWSGRRPVIYSPEEDVLHVGPDGASHPEVFQQIGQQIPGWRNESELPMGWVGNNPEGRQWDYVFNRGTPKEIGWYGETPRPPAKVHQTLQEWSERQPIQF